MYRPDKIFVEQNVLEVIAFPCHEADKDVLSERYLTLGSGRTVGNDLSRFDIITYNYYGALIYTGSLI